MVDSRQKGSRAELVVRDKLREYTDLLWQRVPASGALSADHHLKGDLYIPRAYNNYCVEVKHYKEDQLTSKVLSSKRPILFDWWEQTIRQSEQVEKLPLLIYKFDRSKLFVGVHKKPIVTNRFIFISQINMYSLLLEDWILNEKVEFINE